MICSSSMNGCCDVATKLKGEPCPVLQVYCLKCKRGWPQGREPTPELPTDAVLRLIGEMPTLGERASNFATAVREHIAQGFPVASEEVQLHRLSICEGCPVNNKGICQHPRCGCVLTLKVRWAEQHCPLEPPRWPAVTANENSPAPGLTRYESAPERDVNASRAARCCD
jgi:hypothetical protein